MFVLWHLQFVTEKNNSHLCICILLAGDVETNPGRVSRTSNICQPFSVFY